MRIEASLLLLLSLTACTTGTGKAPYPRYWESIQKADSSKGCPNVEGIYSDNGEYTEVFMGGRPCERNECKSLSYNLLFEASKSLWLSAGQRDRVDYVQVRQPAPDVVQVITNPGGKIHTLSKAKGDFTCDADGIRLKESSTFMSALISNVVMTETRMFNVANDQSLVMKAMWHNVGHHTLLPFESTAEGWVRWLRSGKSERRK